MPGYPERFVKLLYGIIMAQFIVIATLLAGFSNEYLSNIYFRIWVDSNFPQLGLLLTGQVDALLIGMALGGTILLIQRVKNEASIAKGTTATLGRPSSLAQSSDLLPNHATRTTIVEVARETPEQVLGELDKHDF